MRPRTLRRADVIRQQRGVEDVLEGLDQLRKKNEASTRDTLPQLGVTDYNVSLQQRNGFKYYKDPSAHEEQR